MTMCQWTYQGKVIDELPEDCEGFVYLITNTENNKKYVGKKLARFKTSKPPLKGRKNRSADTRKVTGETIGDLQISYRQT